MGRFSTIQRLFIIGALVLVLALGFALAGISPARMLSLPPDPAQAPPPAH